MYMEKESYVVGLSKKKISQVLRIDPSYIKIDVQDAYVDIAFEIDVNESERARLESLIGCMTMRNKNIISFFRQITPMEPLSPLISGDEVLNRLANFAIEKDKKTDNREISK